jgi:hypothetical protein
MAGPRKWTEEDDLRLLALRAEGKATAVIMKELGRSEAAVLQRIAILEKREKRLPREKPVSPSPAPDIRLRRSGCRRREAEGSGALVEASHRSRGRQT